MSKGIISIIFLAAAIATFFGLTKPLYDKTKDLNAQKASFEEALSNSKQIQETRDTLLSQYNKISQEDISRLNKILPNKADSMKFILEMENIAQRNGVILKKIDIKENEKKETPEKVNVGTETNFWETVPFSLKLSSSYKSFYSFLKDIEKNIRLTDINTITFFTGETDFYEFIIAGTFYWKK